MRETLISLVNQLQIKKVGSSYYLGKGKTALDGLKLLSKVPTDITSALGLGVTLEEIDKIIVEIENNKSQSQRQDFDMSFILDSLNDILDNEQLQLDICSMQYVRKVGYDSNGYEINETVDPSSLNSIIMANANARILNIEKYQINGKMLLSQLEYNKIKTRQMKVDELVSSCMYNVDNEGFADVYFKKMHETMHIEQDLDIFICLMKHFCWQVKRRIIERATYNDIMICFFGKQGVGKSYLMQAIFGDILGKFYNSSISLDNLMDERWTRALNTQYLLNIEEMDAGKLGNISGKNLSLIKKVITGAEATYRPLNTNSTEVIKIKASFISNANFHFYDIINDESGMRRFFEFKLGIGSGCRLDYDAVAKLKAGALKMFSSINETLDRGYWDINTEVGKKIHDIQTSYIKKPSHIDFFETICTYKDDMEYGSCISHEDLYQAYVDFARSQGIKDNYITQSNRFRGKVEDYFNNVTKTHSRISKYKLIIGRNNGGPFRYAEPKLTADGVEAD